MNAHDIDRFAETAALGYAERIIPIIPPDAEISERSSISKRIAAGEDPRGKVPGIKWPDGRWSSFDWKTARPDGYDLKRWRAMGAGVGIRTGVDENGHTLVLIDADTLDESRARIIKNAVEAGLGLLPIRVGRYPKAGYLCRVSAPFAYRRITFGEVNALERVEILSDGKQFVAFGQHPATKAPYRWPSVLLSYDRLPVVSPESMDALLEDLRAKLPDASSVAIEGGSVAIDQKSLRGPLDIMQRAMDGLPNTSALFASRESYLAVGYALKAALPDNESEAFELFSDWCRKWEDGVNEPDIVAADWRRMKPPFRRGAGWLLRLSTKITGDPGWTEEIVSEEVDSSRDESAPYGESQDSPQKPPVDNGELELVIASSLAGKPVPEQKWLVRDIIPAMNVTLLGGDGATGKSLLALQLAEAVALSGTWLGMPVERGKVLYLSAEDEIDELHRRSKVISANMWDLHDLVFAPLAGKDAILASPMGRDGQLKPTALFERTKRTIARMRPSLVVFDTLADLFGGDEVKKIHARAFISMLRGLALDFDLTVIMLFHPSQNGMASGAGTSGNVAWSNSVRSRLYLDRITNQDGTENNPDLRTLTVKKANRSASGLVLPLRYSAGTLVREGTLAPVNDIGAEAERVFMALLDQLEKEGRPVSYKPSASNYAPKIFAAHNDGERIAKEHFARAFDRLLKQEIIHIVSYRHDSKPFEKIARKAQDVTESQPEAETEEFFD